MSTPDLVELIKAIGGAAGTIIGAIGLFYARVAAKRSKEASQQTTTTQHVDGQLKKQSVATSAEQTRSKVDQLQDTVDAVLARQIEMRTELARIPGPGSRRADPKENP